jgi:hypothetical protein
LINIRLSGIAGTIAFAVSFLLGVISGTRIPVVLLRALIFAAAFMVLSGGIYALISMYLPDLLSPPDSSGGMRNNSLGSHVDISMDDPGEEGLNTSYFRGEDENSGEFGDNQDDGLDQNQEDGYTMGGEAGISSEEPVPGSLAELASPSETPASTEDMPDFDRMASAFEGSSDAVSGIGNAGPLPEEFNAQFIGGSSNKKTPEMADDFDINEMASAIQTILKREDKG